MNLPVDSTNEELNKLFSSILRGLSLKEDDILEICEITVYKDFGVGECLVKASERTSYVGLVLTGIVRGFYLLPGWKRRIGTSCFLVKIRRSANGLSRNILHRILELL